MLAVFRTDQAEVDLVEIIEYVARHSPKAADRLARAIDDRCKLLAEFPAMGRARGELAPDLRSIAVDPYVLFYRVTSSAVGDIDAIMKNE